MSAFGLIQELTWQNQFNIIFDMVVYFLSDFQEKGFWREKKNFFNNILFIKLDFFYFSSK